jgi:hypothetical protein
MPNVNQQFQGQTLVIPGAYYADNVSATLPANPALTPPLIFIGYGYGQPKNVPVTYFSPQSLLNAIRGGPCASFVQFLTNPSPVLFGANEITYINPGSNTPSTLTLNDIHGAPCIDLTSANTGLPSNLLQAQVTPGLLTNSVNLTLFDGYSNQSAMGSDLGVPFELAYAGTAVSGVSYTVVASGVANAIFSVTSPNPHESFSIGLGTGGYGLISDLVNYLNGTGFYSAVVYSDPTLPATQLDYLTAVPLPAPTGGALQYVEVTAGLGDVVYWVNQFGQNFANARLHSTITANTQDYVAALPLTHFAGARSVPPLLSDYAAALNVALNIPGWAVFMDSNSSGVIALGVAHAELASTPLEGAWRRFISGSSLGDSVTQAATVAQSMDSFQSTYCYPGIYRTDAITGVNTLFAGLYVAASVAGMMSGNVIAQPLTNQALVGNGIEVQLSTGQINTLQQAGVLPIQVPTTTNVPTVVSDLTSWQIDNNPSNVFNQQVACRFGLAYSLSQGLDPYIGSIASPYGITRVRNATISILNQLVYSPGNNGILVSWDPKSLVLTYTGSTQTLNLTVNVVFVGQVRFILELVFVQPLTLAA